jgi:hypothetical protein
MLSPQSTTPPAIAHLEAGGPCIFINCTRKDNMTKLLSLAAAISAFSAAPLTAFGANSTTASPHDTLRVSATFNPAPPKKGSETITVTVKDANGKPVKGATVKIASSMPSMSMGGPSLTARETVPGTYSAKANLAFATTWVFDVSASAGGKSGHTHLSADVK